jgi:hypothetical protein
MASAEWGGEEDEVDGQPTGLLERLRAQRESMQAGSMPSAAIPPTTDLGISLEPDLGGTAIPMPPAIMESAASAPSFDPYQIDRIDRLESDRDEVRHRLDSVEASLRAGLADLRSELPSMITGEVARHATATNEAVAEIGGRVGRIETEFTRERERWSTVVTSFDQRLDQRLRSFRQDVTVMLTGMAVLILAMLMLLLLRR